MQTCSVRRRDRRSALRARCAVSLGLVAALLWLMAPSALPTAGGLRVNHLAVTVETAWVHTTWTDATVGNVPLMGEKQASATVFNATDLSGASAAKLAASFESALPIRDAGPFGGEVTEQGATWAPIDLAEADAYNVFVEFGASEAAAFEPGFSVERRLAPASVEGNGGRQTATILVRVEEFELAAFGEISVAIDLEAADGITPEIVALRARRGDTWIDPSGLHGWWDSGPGPGDEVVLEVDLDVSLEPSEAATRFVPTVTVCAVSPIDDGETTGARLDRAGATGTWSFVAEGDYRWAWRDVATRVVVLAGSAAPCLQPPTEAAIDATVERAISWLDTHQAADGSWEYNGEPNVGVTAISMFAHLQQGASPSDPVVGDALAFIRTKQREFGDTGAVYFVSDRNVGPEHQVPSPVYETSLVIMALAAMQDPAYRDLIDRATEYLLVSQNGAPEGASCGEGDWVYGGWGYSFGYREEGRIYSDLSNTQHALLALAAAGVPRDHEVWERAARFVERCQHPDGGFDYQPPGGNVHTSRSHPTMTAAGVWGLRLLGVPLDDDRIVRGLEWLRCRYAYAERRMGVDQEAWHFYWLWTATRAFLHSEIPGVLAPALPLAGWYGDFAGYLVDTQRADGSWFNPVERVNGTYKEPPAYATGLALLVLLRAASLPAATL